MDTLTQFKSSDSFQNEVEGVEFTTGNPGNHLQHFSKLILSLLVFGIFFLVPSIKGTLYAQSTTCIPGMVGNGSGDPWSEECYLNDQCGLQGSPCNSNDVKIISIYLADAMGNPIPPCNIGDMQTVLVWGVFNNTTGTSRYAIRTRTEAWLNGVFDSEFNACSFDVLTSGQTAVALLGAINMTCGDELQLLNTWIAWNTSSSQCSNSSGANYAYQCNDYSPSKCFKNLAFIDFLTPTFSFFCQGATNSYSNVCFVSSVFGGTPPYTYSWDFGDSGTSTAQNVCHTYLAVSGQFVATLTVTDSIGQSFAVSDTVNLDVLSCPTIFQAPPDVGCQTQTTPINCPATPVFIDPIVTDSCGGPVTITFSDVTTPGSCANTYSVTRTWVATDTCGNSGSCSATIVVQDITPPTLTCVAQTTPINCPDTPTFDPPTVTDSCDGTVTVTFSDVTTPGTCTGTYSVTRTWTATDDCANSATCSSTIVVQDTSPPTITCVAQTTPLDCPATPAFNPPTVSDGCDGTVTLTFSDVTTPGACTGAFSVTRTWTATDDCMNSATCSSTIVVQDATPPTITCVAQTTPIDCPATPVFNPPTATDACDGTVDLTFSDVTTPGACTGAYSVTRTWTATDDCSNTATCSSTIVVQDATPPTITCVAQTTPIDCLSSPVFNPPTASDACDATVDVTFSDVTTPGVCPELASVTRTWTATDDCGNTATCSATIIMLDSQPPVITCPDDVTINCEESTLVADLGDATATDVCDPTVTIQNFDYFVTPPATSPEMRWVPLPPGTISGSCTSGSDCATGVICFGLLYTPGVSGTLTSYTTGFFVDCDGATSVVLSNTSCVMTDNSLESACSGGTLLMNSSGNTGTLPITQNVPVYIHQICLQLGPGASILLDEDEPTDLTTSVNLPGGGTATETPSFTNYTANFDIVCTDTCVYPSNIYRVFVATDDCGNQSTCVQQITVQDTTPPTIICEAQSTPIDCPATPVFVAPTVTDNCDLTVALTFSDVTTPGSCPANYSVTRTWTATDNCLNSATCSATIVVQDITPPTITCATQTTPINCPNTPVFIPPTVSDGCDGSVTVTFSDVTTPGACSQAYSVTRTWTATDDCGNTATCSRTIVVQDVTPPTITCVTQVTPISCPATPVFIPPTATDACDLSVTITFSDVTTPGACPQAYSVTRTWTATDDCGNTATCSRTIVVQDLIPPTITCAVQTTPIACTVLPIFIPPTATDACDASVSVTFSDVTTPGTCPGNYIAVRTWIATDDCGNTASCSATIVVQDLIPPTITCATQTTPINCPATPVFTPPTATDACDPSVTVTFADVTTPGTCPNTYSVARTWTATDDCGNTATCSSTIVVQDITPPTITCVAQTTPLNCPATPVFTPPTATDACDPSVTITFTDVTTPGTCPNTYSVARTWTATDDCGNTATCSSTIVVQDITPPTITCVAQTTPVNCPALPVFTPPTATDSCDPSVTVTFSDATTPGTCPGNFSVTRTWTATDDCGNTATCSATIVSQDITPPTITCATQVTPINCPATPVFIPPTATDACDPSVTVTFTDVTTPGTCPNTYSVARTWTATDDCGNTAICSSTIVVQDITPPTITCVAQTTPINCPATPVFTPPTVTDACDGTVTVTFTDVTTPGTCPNTYSVARTWLATDDCGNTATCSATIVVQDITPPTITCVAQTTPINCPATPVFTPPTATDTCDPSVTITFSDVTTPGTCPNTYSVARTWTATDDCGNTATCSGTIVVQDITPPTITCVAQTTPINCPATPVFTPPTATDTCDPSVTVTFTDITTPGTCPNTYSVARTWTATDDCGNTATCSGTIVVQDITPPTITCVAQTTPVNCPALPVFTPPTATDSCDPSVTVTFSDATTPGTCPGNFSVTRTWTATDDCGNTATCSATIVSQDITPPTITCATQVTPINCPATPVFIPPTATDACDPSVTVTFTDVTTPGTCPNTYSVARTWTATDDCGNTAICSSTIVVQDITPPIIICALQITPIQCPNAPVFIPPTVSDACDPSVTVTFSDVTTPDLDCPASPNVYLVTRTWTATDDCGNTATCSRTIQVIDTTPPTITCATQTTPINCPATPVFIPPTATDSCDPSVTITFSDITTPGTCPNTYSVARTWTATDDCGNTATCSGTIVVQDITPPTITCVAQTTPINCPATPVFTPPTATDACDASVTVTFTDVTTPGTCPNTYSVARTWTATDDCGNTATCSGTIVVQDITPPTITCAAQTTPINCPATPVFTPPTATDTCDPSVTVTFTDASTPGSCPGTYSMIRTWTASDDCGNTATCSATIVVQDITPPTITCATQVTPINCPATPVFIPPTATDACDPSVTVTFTDVTTPGTCPNTYSVARTWTATDDCGNTATCSSTIVVQDITPPTITCVAQTTPINCPATPVFTPPTATDTCDPSVTITFSDITTPGTCPNTYSVTRTWRATDDCGNSSSCSGTIVVQDITPPTITCVAQTTPINCPATPVFTPPTATDTCDPSVTITFTDVTTPGTCPNTYSVARTWTATDDCGNTATCSATIVVQDITPPTITCVAQTTPINCPATPVFTPPTATDTCDPSVTITFADVTTPGTCPNTYSVARTWTATDDCGNTASCSATIVVQDITPPTITCVTQTTPINCPATPVFTPPTATDTCDPSVTITFSDVTTPGTCPNTYSVTRTWRATDDCGNSSSCSGTIVVQDITPPTITCATQITPVNCPAAPVFTPPTATDACDPSVTVTFADVTTPGTCPNTYSVARTWTATDDCGNTATCSSTIVVQDITPPIITCPPSITIECSASTAPGGTNGTATATDLCDATPTITSTDVVIPSTVCAQESTILRTWRATDDCGNSSSCVQTISVDDTQPPVITCPPDITVSCWNDVPPDNTGLVMGTDNCSNTIFVVHVVDGITSMGCVNRFTVTRVYRATDECGNSTTCTQVITVNDVIPPTIVCPQNVTVQCATDVPPVNIDSVGATDNCGLGLTLKSWVGDSIANMTCANRFNVFRTYRATDACGNSATCVQTITVFDNTPPIITCVAQTTPINCPAAPVFLPPTATDNCVGSVTITFTDATTPGACPEAYSVTRTWTASDVCGNTATCSATIVVQDITPPTITCVAQTTPINCPATPVFTPPTATDACDPSVTVTFSDVTTPGTCPNTYSVTRTWRATDDCGNSSSCTGTIVVQDITPPTITCAVQTTPINCPATPVFTPPTATDACDPSVTVTFTDATTPGECPQAYSVTRTWTATDACLNTATCSATIMVQDTTPPTITCATQVTPIDCPATPEFVPPTATDACDLSVTVTFSDVTTPGECPQAYSVTRTWTATDACLNAATCSATIMVQDTTPPTITCATQVTPIDCPATPEFVPPTATDACDPEVVVTFSDVTTPGSCPQAYNVTRTWTATDACLNTATCSATIMVQDTTPPTITCATQVTPIDCPATPEFVPPTATDACDLSVTVTFSDATTPGACPQAYSVTRTWTATDACLNAATCSATIMVQDTTPPTITCATQVTPIDCPATPEFVPPTATDACDLSVTVTFSDVTTPGACPQAYSVTRTWTATDACLNAATCSATIMVQDTTSPTITCATQVTPIDCPATPEFVPPTATDACDLSVTVTFSDVTTPGECPQDYSVTRTWTATDACLNSATCSATIMVQDTTPPTITCATQVTPIDCPAIPEFIPPTVTDACDPSVTVTFSDITTPGTCPNTYSVTRTWTATDACLNPATCSATIMVQDTTPPTITCATQVTPIDCPATPEFVAPTATDSCDPEVIVTFSDVTTPGTCPNTYSVTRTWRATDVCGNSSSCSGTIVVQDITPPTITCVAQTTPIECPASPVFTPPTATDSCDPSVTITFSDVTTPGSCPQNYSVTRTWRATDDCGNSSSCSGTIVVQDITPPSITCPQAVTVQCASLVPPSNIASVTTSDACDPAPIVTFVNDVTVNQTCANRYMVNRTYRSTDHCGNSATCIQVITVFDNTPPTITCPAPVTVQCASLVPAPNTASVTTSDNCTGPAPVVTFVNDVTTNQTCVNRYTLTRTYRSTDACGNSSTCSQVITVFDNTPPTITCPANITVQCATAVPVPNPAGVVTSDNCTGTAPVVTFVSDVTTNQTCINRYTLTRTYRSTDACGNSATCTQVITVFDNTPPVITPTNPLITGIPNNGTLEIQCFGQDPNWDLPTFGPGDVSATDNCTGTVVLTFDDVLIDEGNCPVDGYINRYRLRWTATDACGNSSSLTIFLNLIDTIPPVINDVPEDITVNCDEVPDAPTLSATDECLCACVVELQQDGPHPGCQDGQIITRTWQATDYCGNITIEQQHITLIDDEGPVLTIEEPAELAGLPNGTLLEYTCNEGGIPAFFNGLSAENVSSPLACGGLPTITFSETLINSINCERFGYIQERTFTWTGVDACGNVTTLTITAHLVDDEPPVIVGAPDIACIGDPALDLIEAVDNCEKAGLTHWDVAIPNPCGNGNAFRRTYEAQDQCGNFARDTVIIIPNDGIPPTIEFTNPDLIGLGQGEYISVECDKNGGNYTPWGPDDVSFEDDCPGATLDFEQTTMQVYDNCEDGALLWLQLTWTVTDLCGNSSSLFLYVYVIDETPPVFDPYQSEITIGCNDDWPIIGAIDNCEAVTITEQDTTINTDCVYEYDVIRKLTAVDPCGNMAFATQTIHVGDHKGPQITGIDTLVCNDLSLPNATAWDPCAQQFVPVTMTEVSLDEGCPGTVIERTFSATDACGNVATVVQRIILGDTIPPIILVPTWSIIRKYQDNDHNFVRLSDRDIIKQLNALDESSVYSIDLCDLFIVPVFTLDITFSPNCLIDGWWQHRVYTWVATDVCGNSTVLTFSIDILDDLSPEIRSVPQDASVICGDLPDPPTLFADDDSGSILADFVQTIVEIPGEPGHFRVTRTWTATDPCGNRSVATQSILWIPNTFVECNIILPPVVDCNSHGVVIIGDVDGGIPPFTYVWDVIGQECFIQNGQGTNTITIYVGFFDITISLTVTDAYGCQSVCTAVLDCFDPLDQFAGNPPTGNQVNSSTPNNTIQGSNQDYLRELTYWPNPANTAFNVSFDAKDERDVEISFMNFLGEVVLTDHMKSHIGANTHKIDVTKLPEGTYLFQVKTDKEIHAKGIVIMR